MEGEHGILTGVGVVAFGVNGRDGGSGGPTRGAWLQRGGDRALLQALQAEVNSAPLGGAESDVFMSSATSIILLGITR